MKHLIKRAEIYDGFNLNDKYYEIFKNPVPKEIEDVKKQNTYQAVRGVIYNDGTIYTWSGNILHDEINNNLDNKIDISQFRFAYDNGRWIIDCHEDYSIPEAFDLLLKYENILSNFGDINQNFYICFAKPKPVDNWNSSKNVFLKDIKEMDYNNTKDSKDVNESEYYQYASRLRRGGN